MRIVKRALSLICTHPNRQHNTLALQVIAGPLNCRMGPLSIQKYTASAIRRLARARRLLCTDFRVCATRDEKETSGPISNVTLV